MDTKRQDLMTSAGLLVLRLGVGGFMITHGWGKFQQVLTGNLDAFADPIGLGPAASLVLAAFAEFVCAVLVVVGLGTRFAAIPPAIAMGVAAFVVHGADPWTSGTAATRFLAGEAQSWASKEPALLFFFGFLALALTGAGRFSLDAMIRRGRSRR
jgi:putative oxidoreductase